MPGADDHDAIKYSADVDIDSEVKGEKSLESVEHDKKRKHMEKDKLKAKKRKKMEYDAAEKRKLCTETQDIIAEKLAAKAKLQNPDLSTLELGDLYVRKENIKYTGDWKKERKLVNLPDFLQNFLNKEVLSKQKRKGERHIAVILCMSALRACDVYRATRNLKAGCQKLISKNKLKNDIAMLKDTRKRIFTATPGRLLRILETEDSPLKASEISAVVCDCYLNPKKQTLWETPDTIRVLRKISDGNNNVSIYLY